jgi:ribonuclease VapC
MVLDSSAVVAALVGEDGGDRLWASIAGAAELRMSAVNVLECRMVLKRRFEPSALLAFDQLLEKDISVEPFDERQADLAYAAYLRFGKGSGHAAQLNMGHCAAYALAKSLDLPLLYKGGDFARTDVRPAL